MKALILILPLLLVSCRSTEPSRSAEFAEVTLSDLIHDRAAYAGRTVAVKGYVLGAEIQAHKHGYHLWIVAIGEEPAAADSASDRLVFPRVARKIRVLEDGYNANTIARCHKLFLAARQAGEPVTVMGVFNPDERVQHIHEGIDLHLRGIATGEVRIDTDFGDQTHFQAASPGVLKRMYGGAKKVVGVVGDAL